MEKLLTTSEAALIAGVSEDTIRRWDKQGFITSKRTSGRHRRYNKESILAYVSTKNKKKIKKSIIYTRIESSLKTELLKERLFIIEEYCNGRNIDYEIIFDVGHELDFKRSGVLKLIMLVETNQIDKIILYHKSDLFVIGFELFYEVCKYHNVEIVSLSDVKSFE